MKSTFLCSMGAVLGMASTAMAGGPGLNPGLRPVQPAPEGPVPAVGLRAIHKTPVQIAPILGRNLDGSFIVGEWQPYQAGGALTGQDPQMRIFDGYEGNEEGACPTYEEGVLYPANGPLSGGVEPACDAGAGYTGDCGDGNTIRWFQGAEQSYPSMIQQVTGLADGAGDSANRVAFGWNIAYGTGDVDPCGTPIVDHIIFVTVYDSTVGDALSAGGGVTNQQLADGFKDGVILNFGAQDPGDGYFFADISLAGGDPELPLDGIAAGDALEMTFATNEFEGGEPAFLSAASQPMLWAPKDPALQGTQSNIIAIDGTDDPTAEMPPLVCDLVGSPDPEDPDALYYDVVETADYGFANFCPTPLGMMLGLYGSVGSGGGTPGVLLDASITWGTDPENNGIDVGLLAEDDDAVERLRTQFGFTAFEPNLAEIVAEGNTFDGTLTTLTSVVMSDNSNHNNVIGKVRAFSYTANAFEQVGTYNVAFASGVGNDVQNTVQVTDGAEYVDSGSNFEVAVRYVTPAVFSLLGADMWIDLMEARFSP